jgi:hypothetical protein
MNMFNAHPQEQGITYSDHLRFALGIAIRLLHCVIAFALHAIFPFIGIRRALDLEATTRFLRKQNNWIESREKPQPRTHNNEQWEQATG